MFETYEEENVEKLFLGITGSPESDENGRSVLYNQVYDIMQNLSRQYDVIILTALTSEFDLICLEAAKDLQMKYYIILPKTLDQYLNDFKEIDRNKIINYVNNAIGSSIPHQKTESPYFNAGYYLVSGCDRLLVYPALKTDKRPGGVFDCMKLAKKKMRQLITIHNDPLEKKYPSGKYAIHPAE
jgi:hypothetical protein